MSRMHRADNVGMRMIRGPQRPYGKCPVCQQMRPMHWISRVDFLCYSCLKKSGQQLFIPQLGAANQDPQVSNEQPRRVRPLRQQPRSMKPTVKQQKKRKPSQKPLASATTQENERVISPTPEAQALWDQRRAAAERRTEQVRQEERERKRKELEQRLAQDNRPLPERIKEYRRHRFS